jgi:hypothetical protein
MVSQIEVDLAAVLNLSLASYHQLSPHSMLLGASEQIKVPWIISGELDEICPRSRQLPEFQEISAMTIFQLSQLVSHPSITAKLRTTSV